MSVDYLRDDEGGSDVLAEDAVDEAFVTTVVNLRDASASLYRRSSRRTSLRSAAPRPTISRVTASQEIMAAGVASLGRGKEKKREKGSKFGSGDVVLRKKNSEAVVVLDLIVIDRTDCCINSLVKDHHSIH